MRIIKSPLRISLFGGGTDLPEYFERFGSTIISMAITRSIYLVHNPRPTGGYRLSYSEVEELSTLTTAKHTLIKQAALDYGELDPCTLSIVSDVPKGTGLGSSSALSVALVQLFRHNHIRLLHTLSYRMERKVSNCGIQDHLPASYGGFNVYRIAKDGTVSRHAAPSRLCDMINRCGILLYTGQNRQADPILKKWRKSTTDLHQIKQLAEYVSTDLEHLSLHELAHLVNATFKLKAKISGVVSETLMMQYRVALDNGAIGGKLLGAGGGGCWFFFVEPEKRDRLIGALDLPEIPFQIERNAIGDTYF